MKESGKCEHDGCRQEAEFCSPNGNRLCSDCIQGAVETGEYSWSECKTIPREPEGKKEHWILSYKFFSTEGLNGK